METGLAVPKLPPDASSIPYTNVPLSSDLFTGRGTFLRALGSYFTDQGPGQHRRREYLLHGMGGAGKTQIALRFAETHAQRYLCLAAIS